MWVETLGAGVQAWNADGTSTDRLEWGSWIGLWETKTRQRRGTCAYAGCRRKAEHGGHVWMKMKGLCIVPICRRCNSVTNVDRFQHSDGQHSRLKAGTAVVRLPPAAGLFSAERRIAIRVCSACECDISRRPRNHTLCLACWRAARRR